MQIEHPAQLMTHTNNTTFRGYRGGSLLLHSGGSKGKRHVLKFQHRDGGFDKNIGGHVFQIYGSVNFKYALRSLHRRGFRNIRIVVTEQKPGRMVTFFV